MSFNWSDSIPVTGIGVLGLVHEFFISDRAEYFPLILFCLLIIKGLETGFRNS